MPKCLKPLLVQIFKTKMVNLNQRLNCRSDIVTEASGRQTQKSTHDAMGYIELEFLKFYNTKSDMSQINPKYFFLYQHRSLKFGYWVF